MNRFSKAMAVSVVSIGLGCGGGSGSDDNNDNNQNNVNNTNNVNNVNNVDCNVESWTFTEDITFYKACSPYAPDTSIEIEDGAVLTIEPGVEIGFPQDEWLRVGSSGDGKIIAKGTVEDPIIFTSAQSDPGEGSWLGLRLNAGLLNGSEISNAVVRWAGQDGFSQNSCLDIVQASQDKLTLKDVSFENCAQGGLYVDSPVFEEISGLSFTDIEGFGMSFAADVVGSIQEGFAYEVTAENVIHNGDVTRSATWVPQDVPWRSTVDIEVGGDQNPILTLAEGAHVQIDSEHWIRVGSSDPGGLVAAGSATNPVIIEGTATAPAAGDWLGVRFGDETLNESAINYAVIAHGGQDQYSTKGCLMLSGGVGDGRVSVTNTVFEDCLGAGVHALIEGGDFAEFSGNTFRNMPFGIELLPSIVGSIAGDQTYENVARNNILAGDVIQSATWVEQSIPWRVAGDIEVEGTDGPVLTLEAGVQLLFASEHWLRVGSSEAGGLVASGETGKPVVFSSEEASPTAGSWLGIRLEDGTLDGTILDYAEVAFAGQDQYSTRAAVQLASTGMRVTIQNSDFHDNFGGDIFIDDESDPILTNNGSPVIVRP